MVSGTLASAAAGTQVALAGLLALIALRAWRRTQAGRMGLLAVVFVLFAAEGVVLAAALLTLRVELVDAVAVGGALNAACLAIIYLGVLRP